MSTSLATLPSPVIRTPTRQRQRRAEVEKGIGNFGLSSNLGKHVINGHANIRACRGREGDELQDYEYNLTKPRRRSNSFSTAAGHKDFKTKFETVEPEPVFEEETMGGGSGSGTADGAAAGDGGHVGEMDVDKASTNSSGGGSVEEEESAAAKKA